MKTRMLALGAGVLLACFAIWWFAIRKTESSSPGAGSNRTAEIAVGSGSGSAKPNADDRWGDPQPERSPTAARWSLDRDPEGTLRMEGQVIGLDGNGVAGAQVWLGSVPPKTTLSKEDGTFEFENLVGRAYDLGANVGDLVGGPTVYKLTDTSDPVVIRLIAGGKIEVTVTGEDSKPIAGASVGLLETNPRRETTDAQGKATLRAVPAGWVVVQAQATGYAPSNRTTSMATVTEAKQIALVLKRGVAVSGRVIDEQGKPVAGAHIVPQSPRAWGGFDQWNDLISDSEGKWKVPALAAGTYSFVATDGVHAPSASKATAVGQTPVDGVEIIMKSGAAVSGTVIGNDKAPIPYATIRVARLANQGQFGGALRQVVADKAGKFEVKGLPRDKLQFRAESDSAASKIIDVDTSAAATTPALTLVLDVTGTIAGVVIDEANQPVAEATVNATVDFLGGGDVSAASLSGFSTATTDGGGNFVIRGLPNGAYKVWAQRVGSREEEWGQNGVKANTGDKAVRVVLAAPGGIKGKIVIDGVNRAPKLAMVAQGYSPPIPVRGGTFELTNINPGKQFLTLRGPEFAEFNKNDIVVEPGKVTDVGVITVPLGRKVSGKVVDGSGRIVVGAKVKLNLMLVNSGSENDSQTGEMEEAYGLRTAYTDDKGEFVIAGVTTKETRAVAIADSGASLAVDIPAGTADITNVSLALRGFGSIAGKVTQKGQPLASVGISVAVKGGAAIMTQTDAVGAFLVEKVPEGMQSITVMQQKIMDMKTFRAEVKVTAGKKTETTIDVPVGELSAEIQVTAIAGATVDAAQVFLFQGVAAAKNGGDLMKNFFSGTSSGGGGNMKFWLGKNTPMPVFTELTAGQYSICSVPITGDMNDQAFQVKLQQAVESIKVYCKQFTLAASPAKQSFVHALPSMDPLPKE